MDSLFVTAILSFIFTWMLPIGIIISLVVLFKRVNRLEKS